MLAHNVAALLKSIPGTTRDVIIDEPNPRLGADITPLGSFYGSARLYRTQTSIVVRGDTRGQIEAECARCLEPFAVGVEVHFEEEFQPSVNITTGVPLPPSEDEALQIDEHHVLDLSELVRQYVLTNMPLNPVCSSDCQGLCPDCGANLNEGPCTCPSQPVSGPWASLAELLPHDGLAR
jgi:DUF177 domain-containing protein